jgi:hypothetical protein
LVKNVHWLLTWPRRATRVGAHDTVRENGGERGRCVRHALSEDDYLGTACQRGSVDALARCHLIVADPI